MRKYTILLDIDYTLIYPSDENNNEMGEKNIPRKHLKEFMLKLGKKYNISLYTAGSQMNISIFCRTLYHKLDFYDAVVLRNLRMDSLYNKNCPSIETENGVTIKCLESAAQVLNVPLNTLILIDDNLWNKKDHPQFNQIIQAEAFFGEDDDYLIRLLDIIDNKVKKLENE